MHPVTLIPWQTDFMAALTEMVVDHGTTDDLIVLFPHNRPRRHLKAMLAAHPGLKRPLFMPEMISIADFVSTLRRELSDSVRTTANRLDLVELLYTIIADLRTDEGSLLSRLPRLDHEAFLPWGMQLSKLMDDLLRQDMTPQDLSYMEGEVAPYAAGLLEQLRAIHEAFIERVHDKGWTTSGLDARFLLNNMESVRETLDGKTILAAGFYALSGSEDILFKALWQDGILHPVIHADPALALGTRPHWSAAEHIAWLDRWRVRAEIPTWTDIPDTKPDIRFCEGYDRHSQIAGLVEDMEQAETTNDSAVVLPDEGALLPVLHHLPEKEPNISMGYPLARTSLARLVETLLTLQENRREDGRYYWRDLVALIRHPYLRLLGPEDKPLRKVFHLWEATIREGEKYPDPFTWEPPYNEEQLEDVDRTTAEPLRQTILARCLTDFESATSLHALGDCLAGLAALLHDQGERLWHTYLIDAECLFRLTNSVVPEVKGAETSRREYSRTTLFSFLRSTLSQERVSFEPDPLSGLQVLGVLETRLLHFKRLYILDAVEERLPGTNPYDPLLPDPLRRLLGLPDARERDNVSGYNFHRLLMGAQEAVIYYQNGIQPGLLDSKSVRSRFVEQLLWEHEQKEGRLLEPGDPTVRGISFPTSSLPSGPAPVEITDAVHTALMDKLAERGLSPSGLDVYMQCPKRFFYQYLTTVRPVKTVDEEGDRSRFGSLIHETLKEFLTPFIGVETELNKIDPALLLAKLDEIFAASDYFSRLPLDTRMALTRTSRYRLTEFLASQHTATLLHLEKEMETQVTAGEVQIRLSGQIDRVEQRHDGAYVLDYKTGNAQLPTKMFWSDTDLHDRMATFGPDVVDVTLLADIANRVRSVQIPAYLWLYGQDRNQSPANGGLLLLGKNGQEQLLFNDKYPDEERAEAVDETTPLLIQTLIRHMVLATRFEPRPGPGCRWCDYKTPCGQ